MLCPFILRTICPITGTHLSDCALYPAHNLSDNLCPLIGLCYSSGPAACKYSLAMARQGKTSREIAAADLPAEGTNDSIGLRKKNKGAALSSQPPFHQSTLKNRKAPTAVTSATVSRYRWPLLLPLHRRSCPRAHQESRQEPHFSATRCQASCRRARAHPSQC